MDIKNYEGIYAITEKGEVTSYDRMIKCRNGFRKIKGKKIKHKTNSSGNYHSVELSKEGVQKSAKIHRLVALHFIPNPKNLREVNHIDGDKNNNCVSNLEWCTRKENCYHQVVNGLTGKRRFTDDQVKEIRLYYSLANVSRRWLSEFYGVNVSIINKIIDRTHRQYI